MLQIGEYKTAIEVGGKEVIGKEVIMYCVLQGETDSRDQWWTSACPPVPEPLSNVRLELTRPEWPPSQLDWEPAERMMQADPVLEDHLRQLEERLLQPNVRKSAEEVSELLASEFIEFGSSGRIFDKQQIIASLQMESTVRRSLVDFKTWILAAAVVLVTYRAVRQGTSDEQPIYSLRSSIWKLIDGRWQMVFHQGTLSQEP